MKSGAGQRVESLAGDIDRLLLTSFPASGDHFLSGTELSDRLNVSRTAVWKRIKALRELGFTFDAVPSRGYRLTGVPDFLHPAAVAAGMETRRLGGAILTFTETGSTNVIASRLGEEGAQEGTVVLAESQAHGKGRLGREWVSPPGVNLYCSVLLRPRIAPFDAPQLTLLSAVAVVRAIRSRTALVPVIKWPNDILINGNKVAGLLNEMTAETDRVSSVVLGIGVNLNMARDQFPDDLRHPAGSLLTEGGETVDRIGFTRCLLEELDRLYDRYLAGGYPEIRDEWVSYCGVIGKRVRVGGDGDAEQTGVVRGIDEGGALLLESPDGTIEKIYAGDVRILE